MGRTYSKHGIREMRIEFYFEALKEEDNLGDLDVDGRVMLKWIQ
jgi:hypothetical protein